MRVAFRPGLQVDTGLPTCPGPGRPQVRDTLRHERDLLERTMRENTLAYNEQLDQRQRSEAAAAKREEALQRRVAAMERELDSLREASVPESQLRAAREEARVLAPARAVHPEGEHSGQQLLGWCEGGEGVRFVDSEPHAHAVTAGPLPNSGRRAHYRVAG